MTFKLLSRSDLCEFEGQYRGVHLTEFGQSLDIQRRVEGQLVGSDLTRSIKPMTSSVEVGVQLRGFTLPH